MAKQQLFLVGDKVDLLEETSRLQEKERKTYKSKILDVVDDTHIKISMPMERGRIIPLEVGTNYRICIYGNKGLVSCLGVIEDRYKNENLFVLVIRILSDFKKFQRRAFYRLSCLIDTTYHLVTKEEENYIKLLEVGQFSNEDLRKETELNLEILQNDWKKAVITDISGGGVRLNINCKYEKNDILHLRFPLEINYEKEMFECTGRIIEAFSLDNGIKLYEHRVQFIDLSNDVREAIIKYIFETERKMIRREKGMN